MPRPSEGRTRRSWPQRLLIAVNVVAILAAGITAGALAYGNQRLEQVGRVALDDALEDEELEEGDPLNILLVGIDDASGLPEGDSVRNRSAADLAGQKSDTIMVLRLDPEAGTARLLSLPRDLWVPIAETNTTQRINAAMATGGPGRLIKTINENFGIPIHQYAQVDMAGFRELVNVIDGVPVFFPRPARDRDSGLAIMEPGCYTLGPVQALGFARGRYYDVQSSNGRWHRDPRSDLSRNERQQLFMELALARAFAKGARNLNTLRRLIDLGAAHVNLDELWNPGAILDLARRFRDFDPEDLLTYNLPVTDAMEGESRILYLQEDAAEPTLAIFRGSGSFGSGDPGDVTVQVLNGTGITGQGGQVTGRLADTGFDTIVPEDAEEVGGRLTTILYAEGNEGEAYMLALHLAGPVRYEVEPSLADADRVVLITGTDWEGVAPTPRSLTEVDGPTTTTTASTAPAATDEEDADGTGAGDDQPEEPVDPVEVDDPGDPLFYKAQAPPLGVSCPSTP